MRLKKHQSQRNQQLSDEELQRTQVLNLQDFKETARIERLSSKKPAIIVAAIGLLSISFGLAFPTVQSLSAKMKNDNEKIEQRVEDKKEPVEETVTCTFRNLNQPSGIDELINVEFNFKDDKLYTSKKDYAIVKSASATTEPADIANYATAVQSFLMQTSGYTVSFKAIENGSITTTEVNYLLLDPTVIPEKHQSNYRFNVLHRANTSKADVKSSMNEIGYECKDGKLQ